MEELNLTDEQKEQLKQVKKKFFKQSLVLGLKFTGLLFLTNFIISIIAALYLDGSKEFCTGASIVNAIFLFATFQKSISNQMASIREEVSKIIKK